MTLLLYSVTLFVAAALLFVVQPMAGKMILPLLGGTPAVWSTCMVFFQAALLAGYLYAHGLARLDARLQAMVHLGALALASVLLPFDVDASVVQSGAANPVLDVLSLLSTSIGLPFLVLSASAPLLQKWFTRAGHAASRDPYFLYAASNLGSMLALAAYPAVIESTLPLRGAGWVSQTVIWGGGYAMLVALTALCAVVTWRAAARGGRSSSGAAGAGPALPSAAAADVPGAARAAGVAAGYARDDRVTPGRRALWVALAFVPSSLFIGVTTYITTDVAAVPLLWVLPLAIYLLTFILAFGRWPARAQRAADVLVLPAVLVVSFLVISRFRQPIWSSMLCHLLLVLVVALACHGRLAIDRPAPRHLTEFYLLVSTGGVLGGIFNALVAPLVFTSLAEYPIVTVLAVLLAGACGAAATASRRLGLRDAMLVLTVGAVALVLYSSSLTARVDSGFLVRTLGLAQGSVTEWLATLERSVNKILMYGPPLVAVFVLRRRAVAAALALAVVLLVAAFVDARDRDEVYRARSFFGGLRVSRDSGEDGYTELRHGTTLHGMQSVDPARRTEPLSYYHRESPIAQVFDALHARGPRLRVAVIGLGTGTLAAYARAGDTMVFYEIDPLVRDVAFDTRYFTYVSDARARGARLSVELGDARLRLDAVRRARPDERYDAIVVDAFSSDAIPVHLLTREALQLYVDRLAPGGLLALHISNRHLRLEPVVANLADDAGLAALLQRDDSPEPEGASESTWAVLARAPDALERLGADDRWTAAEMDADPRVGTWTDDFHNLLSIFNWR